MRLMCVRSSKGLAALFARIGIVQPGDDAGMTSVRLTGVLIHKEAKIPRTQTSHYEAQRR